MSNNFEPYIKKADQEIEQVRKEVSKKKGKKLPEYSYFLERLKGELREVLGASEGAKNALEGLTEPPGHIIADIAIPVFPMAKEEGKSPSEIAESLAAKLNDRASKEEDVLWASAEVAGPYVNLILRGDALLEGVLGEVDTLKEQYGRTNQSAGRVALIEYSSVNVAKPIGVGHMRSTIIGQALANVFEAVGYTVIRHNYLGDWGTQFGKLTYAYELWGDEKMFSENPIQYLKDLYVKFHEEAKDNPELEEKGREYAARLEADDPEILKMWDKFETVSLKGFENVYKRLGIYFDTYIGESYFAHSPKKDEIVQQCLKLEDICHLDQETGAVVIEGLKTAEEKELPTFILQKKDGTSLYITRDLAALEGRLDAWDVDEIYIVVGSEQEVHFRQLFALAKRLDILKNRLARHIGFGLVLTDGKKMSTRKGSLIELEGLLQESVEKANEIIKEKSPDLSEKERAEIAEMIGIGAIIYNDLRQSREKNISFDWKKMLDFENGSAAYLQYTCVRIGSIMEKIGKGSVHIAPLEPIEKSILIKLAHFPRVIEATKKELHPHLIATYLEELAQLFNTFYGSISIKDTEDKAQREMRIQLISSVRQVIQNGLDILNIKVPKRM